MSESEVAFSAEGIRKSFGKLEAVRDVSIDVKRGSVLGLIGPNGSGKTTFFNCVSGLVRPEGGTVKLKGQDVTGKQPFRLARLGLGRTFQIATPFMSMTVLENLLVPEMVQDNKESRDRAYEILELLTLSRLAQAPASNLSGGQMKLLDFARVLMWSPTVVLLDEIGAGVHPKLKEVIVSAIDRFKALGVAFLLIEHDMDFVKMVCDELCVMSFGDLLIRGSFDAVLKDPQVMSSYLGAEVD